ncbi:M24 family metallopeptidase [Bdellovibrio bacteriovorus]|uniref:M24 family metallopeptidase n=1 Tax=Bdellovibrio bacteriovorus TaxID=959 RepID=UPI0035A72FF2
MLFAENVYKTRQGKVAEAWKSLLGPQDLVLVHSGEAVQKPGGLDQTYDFLPHPSYFWLTGHRRDEGVMAYSLSEGWIEHQRPLSPVDIVWEGAEGNFECESTLVDLQKKLQGGAYKRVFHLGQTSEKTFEAETRELSIRLDQVRRCKDSHEVQLIRQIADMANKGYQALLNALRPGITERELQLHYENAVLMAGADKMPYGSIVGSGENAAILHAVPTKKKVASGELVLVDAGADVEDYCVDITRVYAVDGKFTSQQKDVYDLVHEAYKASVAMCRPGTQWRDVHMKSARVIAEGLQQWGIWKSSVDAALESGAISVFYPHGVGHLVGLKVRDTGHPENLNPQRYYGARLRVDLELKENYLITVEPGCYFARAFIEDQEIREKYKDHIQWSEAEKWKSFGGVRLEDDILITKGEAESLTNVVLK